MLPIHELAQQLQQVPAGPIPSDKCATVTKLLNECWDTLDGSSNTQMGRWKIVRDEGPSDMTWASPVLSFTIERHGSLKFGSSRAEKQHWSVDLNQRTARAEPAGHRQISPQAKPFTSKESQAIADRICAVVMGGPNSASPWIADGIIAWKSDSEVHIKHGAFVPKAAYQQTTGGRRKRFRRDLESKMKMIGWNLTAVGRTLNFKKQ